MVPSELPSCGITLRRAVACELYNLSRRPSDSNEIKLTCVASGLWIKIARFVGIHLDWRNMAQLPTSRWILNNLLFTWWFPSLSKRPSPLTQERQTKFIILNRHVRYLRVYNLCLQLIYTSEKMWLKLENNLLGKIFLKNCRERPYSSWVWEDACFKGKENLLR